MEEECRACEEFLLTKEFYWIEDCLQDDLEVPEFVNYVDKDNTTDEEVDDTDGNIEDDESDGEDSDD